GEHGLGDVDADGAGVAAAHRHEHPAHAAAEVQRRAGVVHRDAQGGEARLHTVEVGLALGEDLLGDTAAVLALARVGEVEVCAPAVPLGRGAHCCTAHCGNQ